MSQSDIAISVRNLSKAYTISHQSEGLRGRRPTFRDTVTHFLSDPFKRTPKETFWALNDVSFDVKKGEVVGIIGRNGAGKSTLLKILSRITKPTGGEIDVYGRIGSLLEVGTGFHPELTGRENVFLNGAILGMNRAEIRKQFDAIVDFAGVEKFLDTPVKRYSSGMYVRLAFAVAAHLRSETLIIDEVLAVGDAEFQRKCLGKMKDVSDHGRTVLFVSHNMAAVQELCSKATLLQNGTVSALGEVSAIIRKYLDQGAAGEIRPERGPLKRVQVTQIGQTITVRANWSHSEAIRLPNLGFVIHDYMGAPIVGANPYLVGTDNPTESFSSGTVVASLTEPRLLDGQYYISIWFGDGGKDIVELPKCISLDVKGMAGPRQYPTSIVGPVAPRCTFDFSANDTLASGNS